MKPMIAARFVVVFAAWPALATAEGPAASPAMPPSRPVYSLTLGGRLRLCHPGPSRASAG